MYCIVGLQTSLLLLILFCICPIFFLSILRMMKFFVKDVYETVQARVVIFGMQVDNDVLYRGIANQPSPAYSSLYMSNFLSFHTLNDEIFVKDFCETVQAREVIFVCRLIMMYCTVKLRTSLLLLILPCIYLFFFLSTFFIKDMSTAV